MAYTGTGTQADPYIPDTITSLYEVLDICNNDSSASLGTYYIKLESDIDCKNDPDYIGFVTIPLTFGFRIAEFYSNNNKIIGLTIKSNNFMSMQSCSIHDIEFKNCFLKTTNDATVLYTNPLNPNTLTNVKMSLYVVSIGATYLQSTSTTLNNCSIYIDGSGSTGPYFVVALVGNYSNIILNNIKIGIGTSNDVSICSSATYCSVILKNSILWSNVDPNLLTHSSSSYSYVALLNTDIQFTGGTTGIGRGTHNLVASDDYTGMTYTDVTGVINFISISDLQDNQKLIDLGFLP